MILNTQPTTEEWNKSVNFINRNEIAQYGAVEERINRIDEYVAEVKEGIAIIEEKEQQLRNRISLLRLLLDNAKPAQWAATAAPCTTGNA